VNLFRFVLKTQQCLLNLVQEQDFFEKIAAGNTRDDAELSVNQVYF